MTAERSTYRMQQQLRAVSEAPSAGVSATHTTHTTNSSNRTAAVTPLLFSAALLAALFATSPNFRWESGPTADPFAGDFLQEWAGAKMLADGDTARFYDPNYADALDTTRQMGFEWNRDAYLPMVYPPFYYLLVRPLASLPFPVAAVVWALLMVAFLLASCYLLAPARLDWHPKFSNRLRTPPGVDWTSHAAWLMPLAILFAPTIESLTSGQKSTLLLLLFTLTYRLLADQRPYRAGLVFGLVAFKPQLTLVVAVAMLLKRQWRFVLGGASTGICLLAASLIAGPELCQQYLEFSLGTGRYMTNAGYDLEKSHCLFGFFAALLLKLPALARLLSATAAVGVGLLLTGMLKGKVQTGGGRFSIQYSAMILGTVLLSPHLFTYDLTLLLLPMYLTLLRAGDPRHPVGPWLMSGMVALYLVPFASVRFSGWTGFQMTVPLMLGLLVALRTEVHASRFGKREESLSAPTADNAGAHLGVR